jgi:hypothetical protein
MSFFKKLQKEFNELVGDDKPKDEKKDKEHGDKTKDAHGGSGGVQASCSCSRLMSDIV